MANKMSALLDKIERRLGTRPLNLPEHLRKENWVKVIEEDTLPTFSRYFPDKIKTFVDGRNYKNGYYYIDEHVTENYEILGVRDLDWKSFARDGAAQQTIWGYYDIIGSGYGLDDVALLTMRADCTSLFNNGIYPVYIKPNMIRLETVSGIRYDRVQMGFPIELYVQHLPNLMTISPTQMETFEQLAIADVATFLYNELKYFQDLETVFATVNIRLENLEEKANRRDDIVEKLENSYVTAANKNMPIMFTV